MIGGDWHSAYMKFGRAALVSLMSLGCKRKGGEAENMKKAWFDPSIQAAVASEPLFREV